MDRSHRTTDTPRRHAGRPRPMVAALQGFTLIELMVVILIVAVLAGVLIVGVSQARKTAESVATQQFLSAIAVGLGTFEQDFDGVPPSEIDNTGSPMDEWEGGEILAQMMVGYLPEGAEGDPNNDGDPGDGVQGLGFQMSKSGLRGGEFSPSGRTYGPYIELPNDDSLAAGVSDDAFVFNTGSDDAPMPVLYYRNRGRTDSGTLDDDPPIWGDDEDDSRYYTEHNAGLLGGDGNIVTTYWKTAEDAGGPSDEAREEFERSLRSAEFLLVAPGGDELFGTEDDVILTGP